MPTQRDADMPTQRVAEQRAAVLSYLWVVGILASSFLGAVDAGFLILEPVASHAIGYRRPLTHRPLSRILAPVRKRPSRRYNQISTRDLIGTRRF